MSPRIHEDRLTELALGAVHIAQATVPAHLFDEVTQVVKGHDAVSAVSGSSVGQQAVGGMRGTGKQIATVRCDRLVDGGGEVAAHGARRHVARPADDGRHAATAFPHRAFAFA